MAKQIKREELLRVINDLLKEKDQLQQERARLSQAIDQWREQQQRSNEACRQLEVKADRLEAENKDLRQRLEQQVGKFASLTTSFQDLQERVSQVEEERDAARFICKGLVDGFNGLVGTWDLPE